MNNGVDAVAFALCREIGASIAMFFLSCWKDGFLRPPRDLWKWIALCGLFSTGNVLLFVVALNYVTAVNASVFQPAIPVFTTMVATAFQMEAMSVFKGVGIFFSVGGAVVVCVFSTEGGGDDASNPVLGNLMLVGQTLSMACLIAAQVRCRVFFCSP